MSSDPPRTKAAPPFTEDPRWELVQRIVASQRFAKSERLCQLLLYICELSLEGRDDEINELRIGETLFGRAPNYDSSADGIVRSHASRLRHKLEQYFSEEGTNEPLCLQIPKGGYLPVFETRPSLQAPIAEPDTAGTAEAKLSPARPMQQQPTFWIAVSLALTVICAVLVFLLIHPRVSASAREATVAEHPLWEYFFAAGQSTLVVCSDSGLTTLQQISGHGMDLDRYLEMDYRVHVTASPAMATEALQDMVIRRYTPIIDLLTITRLFRLPGVHPPQIRVRYARDVRPDDLKSSSVILLGSSQTDPWVQMFEQGMNFTIEDELSRGVSAVINHAPRASELPRYESTSTDPLRTVYAIVVLRRNPAGSRFVLMLEGTSMAGTEAAADFVFDDVQLMPFLSHIRKADGSIPGFEVLLQSSNVGGYSPQSKIVAYRTTPS